MRQRVILASGSPRRSALLERMGVAFELRVCPTDEKTDAAPLDAVSILARRKACAAAQGLRDGLVLGADTLVALEGHALGKPQSVREAIDMLQSLSGRAHDVHTGVCLVDAATGKCLVRSDTTHVRFRGMSLEEIEKYVATGEPMDKAGAYAIQGGASAFVERIDGSFENVMGLPVDLVRAMLEEMGG